MSVDPTTIEDVEAWIEARRAAPHDGQRLGQAFLNSALARPMREMGRVDPGLFYERDEAAAAAAIRERYAGRAPGSQGVAGG